MASSLLMGLGKSMENVGQTLLGGVMLRAQLEREKMQAVREIEKVKLQGRLEQELMREKAGLENSMQQGLLQQKLQGDADLNIKIESMKHDKAIDLEQKKEDFKRETDKRNLDNFEKMYLRIKGGDSSHISPALKIPFMKKMDEAAGIPPDLQGKGLGAMVLEGSNPEGFAKGLTHLETQNQSIFGGTQSKTIEKIGLSDKGKPYFESSVSTEERPMPKTNEEIFSVLAGHAINAGADPNETAIALRDTLAKPMDNFQRYAVSIIRDPKASSESKEVAQLWMGVTTPWMQEQLTRSQKAAEALIAGEAQTPQAATQAWTAYMQTNEPWLRAIVTAYNTDSKESRAYADDLKTKLNQQRTQYADIFNRIYGPKFNIFIDPDTFAPVVGAPKPTVDKPFTEGHGTTESVRDLKKLMHPKKGD